MVTKTPFTPTVHLDARYDNSFTLISYAKQLCIEQKRSKEEQQRIIIKLILAPDFRRLIEAFKGEFNIKIFTNYPQYVAPNKNK